LSIIRRRLNYQYCRVVHKETLWLLWQWELASVFHTHLSSRDWSHFRIAWTLWLQINYILICLGLFFSCCILSFGWFPIACIFHCWPFRTLCLVTGHVNTTCDRQSFPKHQQIKFRHWGITQKKEYNIRNTVQVWNKELFFSSSLL